MIEELVVHDEEMINNGEVVIDEGTGDVKLPNNKKQRKETDDDIMEENTGKKEIIELLNDQDSTICINDNRSVTESTTNIMTYQDENKDDFEKKMNERTTRKQDIRILQPPFKRANEITIEESSGKN